MNNMLKCLSNKLQQSEIFQLIDELTYDCEAAIALIPWGKETIDEMIQNTLVHYVCQNDEIEASFLYQEDDWQVKHTFSILNCGNKLISQQERIRQEEKNMRIINKTSAIYYEDGISTYFSITEDNALSEPTDETYITFDVSGEVASNMKTTDVENVIGKKYQKQLRKRW